MTDQDLTERFSCAAESLARGESVAGTGISATRFLLVEHTGVWGFAAWPSLVGEHAAADTVAEWEKHGGRVQLIRKHGRRDVPDGSGQRVFLVVDGRTWHGVWHSLEDLAAIVSADMAGASLQSVLKVYEGPQLTLVCTHSQHDPCCAVNGRQVAAALHTVDPEGTWESSHLGGDRFAANVLLFPELLQMGRVPAEQAAAVVAAHRRGTLDKDVVRGIAGVAPAAQVAIVHVATKADLDYRSLEAHIVESTDLTEDKSATHTVKVTGAGRADLTLTVKERQSKNPTFNTCRRTKEATYRVLEVG